MLADIDHTEVKCLATLKNLVKKNLSLRCEKRVLGLHRVGDDQQPWPSSQLGKQAG